MKYQGPRQLRFACCGPVKFEPPKQLLTGAENRVHGIYGIQKNVIVEDVSVPFFIVILFTLNKTFANWL